VQSFQAVNRSLGEARPGWKVLRVLGNLLKLDGLDQETSEAVRDEALGGSGQPALLDRLDNAISGVAVEFSAGNGLERVADVPIHFADPLVRRAHSLQRTKDAATPRACMNAATLTSLGVTAGSLVKVSRDGTALQLVAQLDTGLADNCVRVAAAHVSTINLGAMTGVLKVESA
jgi:NADH-quinone oxidoreductase subunit G